VIDKRLQRYIDRTHTKRRQLPALIRSMHFAEDEAATHVANNHVDANHATYGDYITRKKQLAANVTKFRSKITSLFDTMGFDNTLLASAGIVMSVTPHIPSIEHDQAMRRTDAQSWLKACDDYPQDTSSTASSSSSSTLSTSASSTSSSSKSRSSSIDVDDMQSDNEIDRMIRVPSDDSVNESEIDDDRYDDGPKPSSSSSSSSSSTAAMNSRRRHAPRRDDDDDDDNDAGRQRHQQQRRGGNTNSDKHNNSKHARMNHSSSAVCGLTSDELSALYFAYAGSEFDDMLTDGYQTRRSALVYHIQTMTGKSDLDALHAKLLTDRSNRIPRKKAKQHARDSDDSEDDRPSKRSNGGSSSSSSSSSSMNIAQSDSDEDYEDSSDSTSRALMVPDVLSPLCAPLNKKVIQKLRAGNEYQHISKLLRHFNTVETSKDEEDKVLKISSDGKITSTAASSERSKRKINTPLTYLEAIMSSLMMAVALNAIEATTIEAKHTACVSVYNHMIYVVYVIQRLHDSARNPALLGQVIMFCEEQRKLSIERKFNIAEIDSGLVARTLSGSHTLFDSSNSNGSSSSSSSSMTSNSSYSSHGTEICKRFQSNSCTYNKCKFAHVCSNKACKRAEHAYMSCPFNRSSSSSNASKADGNAAAASSTNNKQPRRK
jgi:hypothetical protein